MGAKKVRKRIKDPEWRCRECEKRRGVSVRSELQLIRIGARIDGEGRIHGGRDIWICFTCRTEGRTDVAGSPKGLARPGYS